MKVKNEVTGYELKLPVQGQTAGMRLTEITLDAHDLAELANQPDGVVVEWVKKMTTRMLPVEFEAIRYHADANPRLLELNKWLEASQKRAVSKHTSAMLQKLKAETDAEAKQLTGLTATSAAESHQAHLSAHISALTNSLLKSNDEFDKAVADMIVFGYGITQHTVDLGAEKLHVTGHKMPLTFGYDLSTKPDYTAAKWVQNGMIVPFKNANWQSAFTPPEGLDPDVVARFDDDGDWVRCEHRTDDGGATWASKYTKVEEEDESFDDAYSAAMKRFVGE